MSAPNAELAWPGGDRPGLPAFACEPPVAVVDSIREALGPAFAPALAPGVRLGALRAPDGPVGRYRLVTPDGVWFVRVSSRWGDPELERSITGHLAHRGVTVNPLLVAGRRLSWHGRVFRVDVRPMIPGRHFEGTADDLARVAATLGACHRALVDVPHAAAVRATASRRNKRLAEIRDLIATALDREAFDAFGARAPWAIEHRDWLRDLTRHFTPRLDESAGAQVLHGEVHPGNVMFRAEDGAAVLVDFEESVHVFAPPAWDLAFLVQRFCLRDDPPSSVALRRLSAVAEAYGAPVPALATMMRQAAWFSVAAVVELQVSHGVVTPVSEYDKFVRLARQACSLEGVL